MESLQDVRAALLQSSPTLVRAAFQLASNLIPASAHAGTVASKDFNDPIWKVVTLDKGELDICELPLFQRLRRVRQLGLGYMVFPSAHHSRFEHSLGAVFAATRMFEQLARGSKSTENALEGVYRTVRLAALLHDCGHPVFSHVGERVLKQLYPQEFATLAASLSRVFVDPLRNLGRPNTPLDPPAAGEVMAALFLLSDAMEAFLKRCVPIPNKPPEQAILDTVALILGRPRSLVVENRYHHWVRGIVSGDLDCDKLDYVARDAYFAGLPVSADVTRLLSQLASVEWPRDAIPPGMSAEGKKLTDYDQTRVLALRPPGVSAFEMFVMTRSYLFERLYGHHKTRAAERSMERLLTYHLQIAIRELGWTPTEVLAFLYADGGDDATLWRLANPGSEEPKDAELQRMARRLSQRDVPRRAIQIAPRYTKDQSLKSPMSSPLEPWSRLQESLSGDASRVDLARKIAALAGLNPGLDLIVDPPGGVPIKESPDVWVAPTAGDQAPTQINAHFSAEQLSNAYRDVKRSAWIFCDPAHTLKVAASTAAVLQAEFDLRISRESIQSAKLSVSSYEEELGRLHGAGKISPEVLRNLIGAPNDRTIIPSLDQIEVAVREVEGQGHHSQALLSLKASLTNAKIPRAYYGDYLLTLMVVGSLVKHANRYWRNPQFREPIARGNEERFQRSVLAHLKDVFPASQKYRVEEHPGSSAGILDILVKMEGDNQRELSVVVELKSEVSPYSSMVDAHSGQPQQYAEHARGPISVLYCQFAEDSALSLAETLTARVPANRTSRLCTICLGVRGFAEPASRSPNGVVAP